MRILLALAASALALAPNIAEAQTFPDRQIRVIVSSGPGGGTDLIARMFAPKVGEVLGQSIVVENKLGAGGNIAGQFVARSKPDGYTVMVSFGGVITINPFLYKDVGYDTIKDLQPVTLLATAPYMMVVNPKLIKATTLKEFVAEAKARTERLSWASFAKGSPDHLAGELFQTMAGLRMTHVSYKSGGEAILDVLGDRVPVGFFTIPTSLPYVRSGQLRPLALSERVRNSLVPDVPTFEEAGVPGYEMLTWYAVWAPAGIPKDVLEKLHGAFTKVLQMPDIQQKLKENGFDAKGNTPEQFAKFIGDETQKYGKIIEAAGLQKN